MQHLYHGFGYAASHFVRPVRQCGDADFAQFTQVTVVKTDYGNILGNPNAGIGQFLDQPVGDFVVVADDGSAAAKVLFDKGGQKPAVLMFLQFFNIGAAEPADVFVGKLHIHVPQAAAGAKITFRPLLVV